MRVKFAVQVKFAFGELSGSGANLTSLCAERAKLHCEELNNFTFAKKKTSLNKRITVSERMDI